MAGDVAAFPQEQSRGSGLTKREYAAIAIAASMGSVAVHRAGRGVSVAVQRAGRGVAEDAVIYADALLAELAK